jgi:histidine triad (HIT) family protein
MTDCIFCAILKGSIPSRKIYEDSETFAFLDVFPAAPGHTLVIPKKHSTDIHSIDAHSYGAVASTSKKVADILMAKLDCDGTSIFQMNREAGGQTVFHLHMHVVPRFKGDDLQKPWKVVAATEEALETSHRRILS